tara:strand:- start:224 stop:613 length:390 start_codon:yes stop_codon:yes gene_type:complete
MSTRAAFVKKQQEKRIKNTVNNSNAFSINGYYPLFKTAEEAILISPEDSYHTHDIDNVQYFMPNGLEMNVTQFHGNYEEEAIENNNNNIELEQESTVNENIPVAENIPLPVQTNLPQSTPSIATGGVSY